MLGHATPAKSSLAVFTRRVVGALCGRALLIAAVLTLVHLLFFTAYAEEFQFKSIRREKPAIGKGDLYTLVVGVSNYENGEVPQLKFADADAKAFGEFLKTQEKVFAHTHVRLMLNEQATKKELEKYLNYELLKAGKDDTVILFLSGHGSSDPKKPGEFFFLSYDADPNYLEATSVKMSGLDFIKRLDVPRVLLVADACNSGGYSQVGTKAIKRSFTGFVKEFEGSTGKVIMTSSKPDESSQEKAGLKQGVFTYFMLKGLKGEADLDRDGVVTLRELYDYVYDRTKSETEGAQHPQLEGSAMVGAFPVSVLGKMDNPIQLEVRFIAQDPRCKDQNCIDPPQAGMPCRDPLCRDVTIDEGSTMYTGQNFQIAFRTSEPSYVYVYHVGPKGDLYKLFPGSDFLAPDNRITNPVKANEICWVPAKDQWLRQDEQQGKERIYVVASRSRNEVLEDLYAYLEKARAQQDAGASANQAQGEMHGYLERLMAPTRGVLVNKPKVEASDAKVQSFEELAKVFQAAGLDAVKSVSFLHKSR